MDKDFEASWTRNFKTAEEAVSASIAEAAGKVIKSTVDRTPVGRPSLWKSKVSSQYKPGALRRSWEANFGHGFHNVSNGSDYDGKVSANAAMRAYTFDYDIIVRNQLEYAQAVEYGWSRNQAPQGMLRISMSEFQKFFKETLKKNRV